MTIKLMTALAGLAMLAAAPAAAQKSREAAALTKCLDDKANAADKTLLMQWVFIGMAQSDEVKAMSAVTPQQRDRASRGVGELFQRLLTVDCRGEVVAAIRADGVGVIESSFGSLGERAMEALMEDPSVNAHFEAIITHVDVNAIAAVLVEAGTAR